MVSRRKEIPMWYLRVFMQLFQFTKADFHFLSLIVLLVKKMVKNITECLDFIIFTL